MATTEADVKKAAELKLWLEGRISQLQEEIGRLKESLEYVDTTLRGATFKPAIEMLAEAREVPELRELKRDKGGQLMAVASITSDAVSIEPKKGVGLKSTTPPFKSFLVGKILEGMKAKDEQLVSSGQLAKGSELRFDVEEASGQIDKLIIENYREKQRLNEILSTVSWTFSRMLEKQSP